LGQMSPQELEEARQYYTDQIMKMEEGILRYQVETIEQYGTVRSAMEQQRTAIAQAIIQAEGRISAARIEGDAEVKAAQYVVELRMIDENINGSKQTQDRLWSELTKETSESWVGSDTQASATKVWAGDGNYQTWLDSYQQGEFFRGHVKTANKNMDGLDPLNKVVFANNANNLMMGRIGSDIETYNREIDAKLAKQLKAGEITHEQLVENGARMRVPQEEILRLQQKVPGLVSVSAEDRATAEDKIAENQMRLDLIRKDPDHGGYLSYDLLGEAMAPTDYDSFIKDLSKSPVPERAKKRIEELEAARAALGGTDTFGAMYNQFMMGGRGDYITQLLGFNSSDDAFRSLIGNPNAQSHIADIYSQRAYHAGATIGDERLEGLEPGIEKARAALAEKLGMKTTDPNDLRLRLKAFRTEAPPLPQPTAVTGAAPAAAPAAAPEGQLTAEEAMKGYEQAYKQGVLDASRQAEQTAVTTGEKVKAEILGYDQAAEEAERQKIYDAMPPGETKDAYAYTWSITPTEPGEPGESQLTPEEMGIVPGETDVSSFDVSTAKAPPKTKSSFDVPLWERPDAPPKHGVLTPPPLPENVHGTPEYKAKLEARTKSYDAEIKATKEFSALPEDVQNKLVSLSLSDDPRYGGHPTATGRMALLESLGGAERVAGLPSYLFLEDRSQARARENEARQKEAREERAASSKKANEEREAALEIAESSSEMTEKRRQLKADLAKKKGERPLPDVVIPTLTSEFQLGGTTSTDTFVPNKTPKPNEELARLLEQYGESE